MSVVGNWVPPFPLSLGQFYPDASAPQSPADVAVVMPTILRPAITQAVASVFAQDYAGRVQLLIGVDRPSGSMEPLVQLLSQRPPNHSAIILTLPYSTSVRHGGPHNATDGGSLRASLSLMANSRYVAYLDDDNAWRSNHLSELLSVVHDKAWAFAQRMLVDQETGAELVVDRWDSLGPGEGRFAAQGGFVDPNCLLLDKVICARFLSRWSETGSSQAGVTADRHFFAAIRDLPHGCVPKPTVLYGIRSTSIFHHFMQHDVKF